MKRTVLLGALAAVALGGSGALVAATTDTLSATGTVPNTCSVVGDTVAMTLQSDGSLSGTKTPSNVALTASGPAVFNLSPVAITGGGIGPKMATLKASSGPDNVISASSIGGGTLDAANAVSYGGLTLTATLAGQGMPVAPGSYTLTSTLSCTV